ncbi:MAG: glutaredoxin family protein [Gammaproteobacteria bacterium]|nr:glutaredoxin family protein [Gammaproteobacteria bacterium]
MGALTLYMRAGCHLCEEMHQALLPWQGRLGFSLELVDIDASANLVERFNTLVPVLMSGDTEICHYFLDEKALQDHFRIG